ncbi:pantoate--beta-alanine ligase [Luminiphilus sp.]|jgi:pantoate--beta-alanine ligase|nr:pantoate--beta-alanine ligase [Luminiphilus sp.]MDA8826427.1 pantoate--beta-alanine ligase [Luminiphilus sp.]MDA9581131.1 pantoate--beta-alanine ligase [Luminiphilus sp.]MDB2616782.1 pantoate--beta-alanine ligase [Luminiphilus sp.]
MEIAKNSHELRQCLAGLSGDGTVAFVPTMGNLHEGHLSLVRRGFAMAKHVIVSIFVNPLQFSPTEDLEAYPRTLKQDLEQLAGEGVALVFTPSVEDLYPSGLQAHTKVTVPGLTDVLCGRQRAGHFDGVTTVVCKLLNLVSADIALFGEKDLQQLLVIRKMVADLGIPVQIEAVPTQRNANGLALSSRNGYLTPEALDLAPALYRNLMAVGDAVRDGARDYAGLCSGLMQRLNALGFVSEYCEARRCSDLLPAQEDDTDIAIFCAASLEGTRLIDNIVIPHY